MTYCTEHNEPLNFLGHCEVCLRENTRKKWELSERLRRSIPMESDGFCECGGTISLVTHACGSCGLEAIDVEERRLVSVSGQTSAAMDSKLITGKQKEFGWRGFTCLFCVEWFKHEKERFAEENFGFGSLNRDHTVGSDLTTFRTRKELNDHIRIVHRGKRPSFRGNSDHRLNRKLIKELPGENLSKESCDTNVPTVEGSPVTSMDTTSTSTASSAINSSLLSTSTGKSRKNTLNKESLGGNLMNGEE